MARKLKDVGSGAVLVIHGGAGVINRSNMTPGRDRQYRERLERALKVGYRVLRNGGSSLDAVTAAIKIMENSPLFNAGKGSVFTRDGRIELDAAVMDGATKRAGAVTGLTCVKNPITAARAVMERSGHVLLMSRGADQFVKSVAKEAGLALVDPSYFWTKRRRQQLEKFKQKERTNSKKRAGKGRQDQAGDPKLLSDKVRKYGTVGAVAVDLYGNLAAATSTGGITGKRFGRVGDTPIIGAGTYADNVSCAVSATGQGEFFMRHVVGHEISSRVRFLGNSVGEAASAVIGDIGDDGGDGGVIVLDCKGNYAMTFNSEGMFRGVITAGGDIRIGIYRD